MTGKQKIHMSGIAGIGMSALAQYLAREGADIVGTDIDGGPVVEMLQNKGIALRIGKQIAENVSEGMDLLIYSDAVKETNPERVRARELNIPELSYFEMLGRISEGKTTLAVSGTHGKTTTTGMLSRILRDAGASPSAIIGSIVTDFESNYLPGESDLFVIEACEYNRHFLNLTPHVLVVTNLEFDHTDYFADLEDVQKAFRALMEKVPENGIIVTDTENPNIIPLLEGLAAPVIHYPSEPAFALKLPGEFNQMNARAAAAAAKAVLPELTDEKIAHSLAEFRGSWRRFEHKGRNSKGVDVYDDYAHHPTAIRETLRALRAKTKGKVIVAFHPHLFSRTRDLLDGFARSFGDADRIIIAPIYAAREIDDGTVSAEILANRIREEGGSAEAVNSLEQLEVLLSAAGEPGDAIMTMGAGDVYKVAEAIVVN